MERGCVESDEIRRSKRTEPRWCGDRAMNRRKDEEVCAFVVIACLEHAEMLVIDL